VARYCPASSWGRELVHDQGEDAPNHRAVDAGNEQRLAVVDSLVVALRDREHAHRGTSCPYACASPISG
jgi:hypothetical protein